MSGASSFWLAPVLPLAAFAVLALGLARFSRLAAWLATAAVAGSLVLAALSLAAAAAGVRATVSLPWLVTGNRTLELGLQLDPLTAFVATVVAVVACVVFVYAIAYLRDDPDVGRFFAELSLFVGSMLVLVLASDLITLFIAWELVGFSSYLLIGYWMTRPGVPEAATKAFLVTRLADLAMLLGVLLLIAATGTGNIAAVLARAHAGHLSAELLLASALLLFAGAAGKSAQVPFQGWLPDAMLGPTPVSALLHSATMVAAGVFLVARLYPLFQAVPVALGVVAWVGAVSSLLAACAALAVTDLKRLLAYSTISQIGLMFVGLGAGSLLAGVLLLSAHALYKCLLFLGAGAVDHAVEGTDLRRMGGLVRRMPATFVLFALAAAALAGLPVTVALPPKDLALAAAAASGQALFATVLLASLLTALYSARALGVVFLGRSSDAARAAEEASPGLLVPMISLGVLVVGGLLLDAPLLGRPLGRLLGEATPVTGTVTGLALAVAGGGVLLGLAARWRWPAQLVWPPLARMAPILTGEFGLRWVYQAVARGGLLFVRACAAIDRAIFDALAGWAAGLLMRLVGAATQLDLRGLDASIRAAVGGVLTGSELLRRLQTGLLDTYLLLIALWALGAVVFAVAALVVR